MFADPANVTDSPDLGPPPVAHFDEGDPIKFDARVERLASRALSEPTEGRMQRFPQISRPGKRGERNFIIERLRPTVEYKTQSRSSIERSRHSPDSAFEIRAKRKLNMRDEENQPGIPDDHEKDVFQLDRGIADSRASESAVAKPNLNRTNKLAIGRRCSQLLGCANSKRQSH